MGIKLFVAVIASVVLNITILRVRDKWPNKLKSVFVFAVLIILGFLFVKGIGVPSLAAFGWFIVGFFHGGLFVLGSGRWNELSQADTPIKRINP